MPNAQVKIEWFGEAVKQSLSQTMQQRLGLVARLLSAEIKVDISIPVRKALGKHGRLVVVERSKPGEPPRLETGNLRRSVFGRLVTKDEAHVGVTAHYGLFLEQGTVNMAPRPYLQPAFLRNAAQIQNILTAPAQLKGG